MKPNNLAWLAGSRLDEISRNRDGSISIRVDVGHLQPYLAKTVGTVTAPASRVGDGTASLELLGCELVSALPQSSESPVTGTPGSDLFFAAFPGSKIRYVDKVGDGILIDCDRGLVHLKYRSVACRHSSGAVLGLDRVAEAGERYWTDRADRALYWWRGDRWAHFTASDWSNLAERWLSEWRQTDRSAWSVEEWQEWTLDGNSESDVSSAVVALSFSAGPSQQWQFILSALDLAESDGELSLIAAGPMEDLLAQNGEKCIDRVEEEAARNPTFAQMLTGVWKNAMTDEVWERVQAIKASGPGPGRGQTGFTDGGRR